MWCESHRPDEGCLGPVYTAGNVGVFNARMAGSTVVALDIGMLLPEALDVVDPVLVTREQANELVLCLQAALLEGVQRG